ncbi:hypothetical protein A2926_00915 [Candidatus Giovannonibacteria bacterium RIFCSPLOWO2_01_FULL_44_40]|uniref:Uncharacterized protein n=1 Tax=Candidatus Giovannonibacteria bacterium RIFCSPHIGHO2_01_FULL_45_23 TaxID=1798325 RepID=A0A1F5VJ30_9BACT|nr:MAG: hypothetical protein A2834_01315 [Candidatus Giovannonibacteria bacterium RIFCSPHIGHO2_01_FULL_45_23]OGF75652.1 MAG: hypothetical protein A3C77_03415 [Candidatus Giovannonibacteria bacterium RIFCSPHIGHO2_02_FULL_45_13]OGF80075.1 MAG: hypothetical protein A2926_00915 [Candidatus Giovannonibacteria bacterium RIFCSPLOWO2_01_FULL_44_40]
MGKMGLGIVEVLLARIGCEVIAFDISGDSAETIKAADLKLKNNLYHLKDAERKLFFDSKKAVFDLASKVSWCGMDPNKMAAYLPNCDFVIEAVYEDEALKKSLYQKIEKYAGAETPIFSNTSTIQISRLAAEMTRPERFMGLHFFNPVPLMPVVEVIIGKNTSKETGIAAAHIVHRLEKKFCLGPDSPGFVVNGAYVPAIKTALEEHEAGATCEEIDKACTTGRWVNFPPARKYVETLINESVKMIAKYKADPRLNHLSEKQARENIEELMRLGTNMPAGPFELDELLRSGEAEKMACDVRHPQRWKICLAMGPFKFIDLVGIDVATDCVYSIGAQEPERGWKEPALLVKMKSAGKLGQKSGEGFYRYGPHVRIEYPEAGYAKIVFENGKKNSLAMDLIKKLRSAFAELKTKPDLKAVFLQGSNGNFATGADIGEFPSCLIDEGVRKQAINEGRLLLEQIMDFPAPVIAAVEMFALGGAYEIALACDLIIATEKNKIGLPEKGLGILPGWLGTQTLARRVGLEKALWMILGAEMVEASASWIDVLLKRNELTWTKLKALADGAKKRQFEPLNYNLSQKLLYARKFVELYFKVKCGIEPASALIALKAIWRGNKKDLRSGAGVEWNAILEAFGTEGAEKGIRYFLETGKHLYKPKTNK